MADFRGNHHRNEVYPQLDRPTTLQSQNPSSTPDSVTQTEGGHNGILPGRNPLSGTPTQNQPSLQRRRSYQPTYATLQRAPNPTGRGLSMAGFGAGAAVPAGFQFSQSPASAHSASPVVPQSLAALNHSSDTLSMSTLPHDLVDEMESTSFANMGANRVITGHQNLNMFDPPTFDNPFEQTRMGPAGPGFTMGANGRDTSMHGGHPSHQAPLHASIENIDMLPFPNAISATEGIPTGPSHTFHQNLPAADQMNVDSDRLRAPQHDLEAAVQPPQSLSYPLPTLQSSEGPAAQDGAAVTHSRIETQSMPQLPQKSVYSKSGFDMMRALNKVANRKNPEVNIGAVDMSCAFLVCDVTLNDCPIVYVSDSFENLTGYTRHEIVGKNCRFLQAPDGHVEAGVRREFVDDAVVFRLKQRIAAGREVQESLINYRKGGKPFLNLLTAVPISWDTEEIRFFVGFQIDLVECPQAISSDRGAGGVKVDYANSSPGRYTWEPPVPRQLEVRSGQTLGMDDVSTLLQQFFAKGAVASDWHKQSWHKMLLENADDVIHVISLKGAFQYISPSCKRVLEYDPTELAGSSLSSICHPSDIVPVTRELKDASGDALVNIVFRIRRKHSGYMWFESHGSLFSEHGKGRKCIILLGRRRPTFALSRQALINHGGSIGDNEIWTKLTTSGMLLFVSPSARPLLDLQPDTLIGTSFQDLMRKESRVEFGRTIEKARRGKIVSCKHEIHNRRGQALLAQTFFYPGDGDDSKPSFLLAQTKLVKSPSRSLAASNSGLDPKQSSTRLSSNTPSWDSDSGGRSPSGLDTEDLMFAELGATKCSSWQFELRQMEKHNRILTDELNMLLSSKKKRKRRKGGGNVVQDCANCHTQNTPEWRRGPSGQRDLCNSCGLRWAKHAGRASSRNSSRGSGGNGDSHGRLSNVSSVYSSPKAQEIAGEEWGDAERSSSGNGDKISSDSGGHDVSPGSAATASPTERAQPLPPHSQPQLEGGSGTGMTAIREE